MIGLPLLLSFAAAAAALAPTQVPLSSTPSKSPLTVTHLRCEHLVDPLGIDVPRPRLSWVLESAARAQRPKAWRILVAEDPSLLELDAVDVWDSGKIDDDGSIDVEYRGPALQSHDRRFWKVMVWDQDGRPSAWSAIARWSMGPLAASDWTGEWIGWDGERTEFSLAGAKWIGFADDPPDRAPATTRLFAARPRLPEGLQAKKAELLVTADNRAWVVLNGVTLVDEKQNWRAVSSVDVTKLVHGGENELRVQVRNDEPGPAGLLLRLTVQDASGATHTIVSDGSWRALAEPGAEWSSRALDLESWPAARELGEWGCEPWKKEMRPAELRLPPPPLLRTTFTVGKPLALATVYVTALGLCDVHLNGARVSDDRFTPGWTDYAKRVGWRAFDVTKRVHFGENVLGAVLADGWYSGYIGWGHVRDHYGKKPRFKALLHLEHTDGTSADVVTDGSWQARSGGTRKADFLMGEVFDAQLAASLDGWDRPGVEGLGEWHPVDVGAEVDPRLQWHPGPPVRAYDEVAPVAITEPKPGVWVFDLGQNFAGVARLSVRGAAAGQRIQLHFAERLNPDGTGYRLNLRSARSIDTYTCRGGGAVETWQPRFTFHGFQYVEVTGLISAPTKETITGIPLSSATPVVGSFECAEPMLNRLWKNCLWTQRSNFIDVPTDCPQRDERLGWTGDAQVFCRTATYNTDAQPFFTKWVTDLIDAQRGDGQFPMVAPLKTAGDDGGPAWADAGVVVPWTVYDAYGDLRLLERAYPAMVKFLEFCRGRCTPELLPPNEFHCFGDWLNIDSPTPDEVIYLAYFARSTELVARSADALRKYDEAAKWRRQFDELKAAFQRAYVAADGTIRGDSQTAYALALSFDLLEPPQRAKAAERLLAALKLRGDRLSTGFVGTKDLMLALTKIGRSDVAWHLLKSREFPSWGFTIEQGATSIWERWDGWTPEKGFQSPEMNSFAHYAFGAVYEWMFENVGGIRASVAGWKELSIAPRPDPEVAWAKTSCFTPRGLVATDWKQVGDRFELEVTLPPGTTATIFLPTSDVASITEGTAGTDGGSPIRGRAEFRFLDPAAARPIFGIDSGTWRFACRR